MKKHEATFSRTCASFRKKPLFQKIRRLVWGHAMPVILAMDFACDGDGVPVIVEQPQSLAVAAGQSAAFSVKAIGALPLSYQWKKNDVDIIGANSAEYTLSTTTIADNGSTFSVLVSNAKGRVLSNEAALLVHEAGQSKKDRIIQYLKNIENANPRKVLSGQNSGHLWDIASNNNYYVNALGQSTGKYPAMMGVDYGMSPDSDNLSVVRQYIEEQWQSGGLVSISFHPSNPATGGDAWDASFTQFAELITPGNSVNAKWMEVLTNTANELEALKTEGIIVLWRPLHEMNGRWFWWGPYDEANGQWYSSETFINVWKHMYEYFTKTRSLDNLIWVYSANVCYSLQEMRSVTYFYPGDTYVDVVGLDWYTDQFDNLNTCNSYDELLAINKPIGITEFGPVQKDDGSMDTLDLLAALKYKYSKISFFMYWHSWDIHKTAIVDCLHAYEMMHDPAVVNRGDIVLQ